MPTRKLEEKFNAKQVLLHMRLWHDFRLSVGLSVTYVLWLNGAR